MSEVLKPCPFCGEALTVRKSGLAVHQDQSQGDCFLKAVGVPVEHPASVTAWNTRAAPKVKPLVWLKADDRKIELGRCHGYDEWMAYLGHEDNLHWYRIYPVSDGKWRWVEQFRMTYIKGNNDPYNEPCSANEAKAEAQAYYEAQWLSALDTGEAS